MIQRKPVFYDEEQRRWRRTRRLLEAVGAIFTLLLFTFFFSLISKPSFPEVLIPDSRAARHAVRDKPRPKVVPTRAGRHKRVFTLGKAPQVPQNYDPLRAGFYVSWDATSLASLKQHYRYLDLLIPEAIHAISPDGRLSYESDHNLARFLESLQANHEYLPLMPLVNNFDGAAWRTPEVAAMLGDEAARRRVIQSLFLYALGRNPDAGMTNTRLAGIAVDFEEVPRASQPDFQRFVKELGEKLHTVNLKLMVALPAADSDYNYAAYASAADAIILMNYDQHWLTSAPGPLASQDWFTRNLTNILEVVPPEKLVMGIANYAYDWAELPRHDTKGNRSISFQQSLVTAQESEAEVEFDAESLNPHFSYEEGDVTHRVWMLDAITAYNQERAAERLGVRGTALWRLGSEDPSLWAIWDATKPDDAARAKLAEVPPGYDLVLEGDGDIWRITATPQPGKREFRYDPAAGEIVDEKYRVFAMPYRIDQVGGMGKRVAITFDDGPDSRFTPKILDILKEKNAKAAFFSIGVSAAGAPGLLLREYREGHEIGNHTWTHPAFNEISRTQIDVELSLTERLLESELGVKTRLFRPPYGIDHQPESPEEVQFLPIPQSMGYILVGSKIDPHDWGEQGAPGAPPQPPPPAGDIVERVLKQAKDTKLSGHIVLLHDGGGDRANTVAALPRIIDGLRREGFEIVPVSQLIGEARAQTMPALESGERWLARADSFVFSAYHILRLSIAWIFLLGICLVSARALFIGVLAVIEKLLPDQPENPEYRPLATVVIPAYNEEEAIVETVQSVLHSDYPNLDVVVIDDGSRDSTAAKLEANFGSDARVRIFHQANQGKPAALNRALAAAHGEVIVTLDGDTALDPAAVSKLVRHFADPEVAGVAGNAKVANRRTWLTRWQALEYVTSQNLEKRAFHLLNCITVVPGAIGAWRAAELHALGGFPHDTVAEDTDLTLAMRRDGKRILYDEEAIARTQAPETAATLIRQRFRWTFGTLQAVWKHRDTIGRWRYGTLGWIAIPNIFLFQFVFPLVSPIIDLMFLGSLALWGLAQFHVGRIPQLWTTIDVERSFLFFVAFMLIDFVTCVIAFMLEKREEWSLLLPLLLQRFYYRQMMYVVLFRAIKRAMQGNAVGWGRIEPRVATPAPS